MPEGNPTNEALLGEAILGQTSPFEFDLEVAAKLGARAEGAEIALLSAPSGMVGVPAAIPVTLHRGATPMVTGVEHLFEAYRLHPARKSGQAVAQTFAAFCNLTNRHKVEASAIFANMDWRKPSLTAVIDYHQDVAGGLADNGKHRVHYTFPLSEEWQQWMAMNGQKMKQNDFAWFLEDRIPELASPSEAEKIEYEREFATTIATPAQVVELSRGLKLHVDTKVKAATTLQSGEGQISWEESHNDAATGKPIKVPGVFMLAIAPFFMGDKVRIPVRLRYRPENGAVTWFYQIYRPDQFITQHVRDTLAEARDKTGLPAFEGAPEMSA